MRRLLRRKGQDGGTAVVDRAEEPAADFTETLDELRAEIERLTQVNRSSRDPENERLLLRLRHLAGIRMLESGVCGEYAAPAFDRLLDADGLPEIPGADVTPELLRAGILRDGCMLVRGLVARDAALRMASDIDRSFTERERQERGDPGAAGFYEEFQPHARRIDNYRPWIKAGGGVLAADSPRLTYDMIELFRTAGLPSLVEGYLGEPALISAHKTTLRKADPAVPGAWHQDGKFMGDVRSLDLWLSLSRCGDEAPGLDVVPRRLEQLITTQTEEAALDIQVSQSKAEEAAGDKAIMRPIFEPGDALFFDELFLHKTASEPSMPKPRFAIENWFFAPSAFPREYAPLAV